MTNPDENEMKALLKKEWLRRLNDQNYSDEQIKLWWSGVSTAWRLLKGHPPPLPEIPERRPVQAVSGRTPCGYHKGFKEDCGCP